MNEKIKIMIAGYGNIGRGVNLAIKLNPDMQLAGIMSRDPNRVKNEIKNIDVYSIDDHDALKNADVAILCGGSKEDIPEQGPLFAKHINTVDSFDNHSEILNYFKKMDKAAKDSKQVSVISTGWDPGTFSLQRVLGNAFIPGAKTYGFYGLTEKGGLSMGHSDALRTIMGIKDARQFTHAIPEAIEKVRSGHNPNFKPGDMHIRRCYVVLEEGASKEKITKEIISMPGYFSPYKTFVDFVTQEELDTKFSGFPHDGCVIGAGVTGKSNKALIEYRNVWGSNPEATGNILIAHARAAYRFHKEEKSGAYTILDIPATYLSHHARLSLIENFM